MSKGPIISISGIRGVIGKSLNVRQIVDLSAAFGTMIGKVSKDENPVVVLGRDSRTTGELLSQMVRTALRATGCKVVDLGIVPTPTVAIYLERIKAAGGVVITASHNPAEWNGLKFMNAKGLFLSDAEMATVLAVIENDAFQWADFRGAGTFEKRTDAVSYHLERILNLPHIDRDALRKRKFRVAVDTVRGAGGPIMRELLEGLGCDFHGINLEPDGQFPHDPEPRPDNLRELCSLVQETGADLGFACDPDTDRLTLVSETGVPLSEEMTIVLAAQYIMGRNPGPMVVNLSTTRAMDELAAAFKVKLYRSPVGELNVVREMVERNATVGGEGNGGVILPELHLGRDAPLAAALTLSLLAESGKSLSQLTDRYPRYHLDKIKYAIGDNPPETLLRSLQEQLPVGKSDLRDGLRFDLPYGWLHARKSNTEPIIRVVMEAVTETHLKSLKEITDRVFS
ncbi:phosphoglucosamine mutase [candidate division KSB1 bacterium]